MHAVLSHSNLRLYAGWVVLLAGGLLPWMVLGAVEPGDTYPALILTVVFGIFFLLLVPVFGNLHEWRTVGSALVVCLSFFLLLSQILNNTGDWPIARLYHAAQSGLAKLLGLVVGDVIAQIGLSPLYILTAMILLVSFAMRSPLGFYIVVGIVALNGLVPFKPTLVFAGLLWCSGFVLARRPHLHFPPALRGVLTLDESDERFLLELRERPLSQGQAVLLLGDGSVETGLAIREEVETIPPEAIDRLSRMNHAGLIEYDAAARKIQASSSLQESRVSPEAARFINVCGWIATIILMILAVAYLIIPIDFLPEALAGPMGYFDDLILLGLASLPVGDRVVGFFKGLRRR